MKPLKITAYLKSGFSAAFDWSVSIDSVIAYQSELQKLGWNEFVSRQSSGDLKPVEDLPIEKEHFNEDWWYQVSRPFFDCKMIHTKHLHRRFNAPEAESYVEKISKIETTKGAYKNARLARQLFITPSVTWYVNGDKEQIGQLLEKVTHIGANRGSGHGAVNHWEIVEHDNIDDCRFKRALPIEFAAKNDVSGILLEWAIRPPYTLAENVRECVVVAND